jgi:serine/threonine-protein kinase
VIWFVFGAVAGRVAWAIAVGKFEVMAMLLAMVVAWPWAWFVFEALAGVVAGSVAWAITGAIFGIMAGSVNWTFAATGIVAGAGAVAVSKAGHELQKSFSRSHTFVILAGISLSGLVLGRFLSGILL